MEIDTQELLKTLKKKITIYEHLGIDSVNISADKVHFHVSLAKNQNHKGTAFGGSLYAVAVLAAYALVLAGLRQRGIKTEDIVIAKGEIQYLRPVESDFDVICEFPSCTEAEHFYTELKNTGYVRGTLKSQIFAEGGSLKASLKGVFVVKC